MIELGEHEAADGEKYNVLIMNLVGPSLDKVFDPKI